MKKIPTVFKRNYDVRPPLAYGEVTEGCEWVLEGEGMATRKWDGTCCMVQDGVLYKRYDAKNGKKPPEGFIPAQDPDPITGHWPGWVKVDFNDPANKWHKEAWGNMGFMLCDDTYELIGPKVTGNHDNACMHLFVRHKSPNDNQFPNNIRLDVPRTFNGMREFLKNNYMEGIVFHHPNGDMAKIKRSDFGLAWGQKKEVKQHDAK